MKIQIDTQQKTVKLLDSMNLKDLIKNLKNLLGDKFDEYTLISYEYMYSYIPWTNPTVINPWKPYEPIVTWMTTTADTYVYNVELQEATEPIKS